METFARSTKEDSEWFLTDIMPQSRVNATTLEEGLPALGTTVAHRRRPKLVPAPSWGTTPVKKPQTSVLLSEGEIDTCDVLEVGLPRRVAGDVVGTKVSP